MTSQSVANSENNENVRKMINPILPTQLLLWIHTCLANIFASCLLTPASCHLAHPFHVHAICGKNCLAKICCICFETMLRSIGFNVHFWHALAQIGVQKNYQHQGCQQCFKL